MDPGTAMLIATAVATAAKGGGDAMSNRNAAKAAKMRAKETRRETQAGLYNDALQRSAELAEQRLSGTRKLSKRKTHSLQETADLLRGALSI